MPNHFDSILVIEGEEEVLNQFIRDFIASAVAKRLCICQFADPIPHILYFCMSYGITSLEEQRHWTGRALTEEEKEEIRAFGYNSVGEYAGKWWGLQYGCYDFSLKRNSPNKWTYKFWVPIVEVPIRIGQLLHIRYPSLTFTYNGVDECDPFHTASWTIKNTDPILTKEEIDNQFLEMIHQRKLELARLLEYMKHPGGIK